MTKAEMRRVARARLAEVDPRQRDAWARSIAARVWEVPEIDQAEALLLYASLPSEVPTDEIARAALERGITVTYPRCLPETRELSLHRLTDLEELVAGGEFGVREPHPSCPVVRTEKIDAALIPGLAWDRHGRRLGRGAGYYDRLLSLPTWRGFRCGLFFGVQEFDHIPADPWDVGLQAVVTEDGIVESSEFRVQSSE